MLKMIIIGANTEKIMMMMEERKVAVNPLCMINIFSMNALTQ